MQDKLSSSLLGTEKCSFLLLIIHYEIISHLHPQATTTVYTRSLKESMLPSEKTRVHFFGRPATQSCDREEQFSDSQGIHQDLMNDRLKRQGNFHTDQASRLPPLFMMEQHFCRHEAKRCRHMLLQQPMGSEHRPTRSSPLRGIWVFTQSASRKDGQTGSGCAGSVPAGPGYTSNQLLAIKM